MTVYADAIKSSPHGSLEMACDKCHLATSWSAAPEKMTFDHNETSYPLVGRHLGVSCRDCHTVLEFDKAASACAECHIDPHRRQFGTQCVVCHTPESWENRSDMELRHSATRFPLGGVHRNIACQSCHSEGRYVGTSVECASCHLPEFRATRNPDHVGANFPSDCRICHSLDNPGWEGAGFTHPASFPLDAGHAIQDCATCHRNDYRNASTECAACHLTDYNSVSDPNHQALPFPQECQTCHTTTAWTPAEFDHALSRFQLTGAHRAVDCASCHFSGRYTGTSQECFGCHEIAYRNVADPNHVSGNYDHDCATCHTDANWSDITFDHNLADFALTGAHQTADCASCHIDGKYNGIPQECYPCHETNYDGVPEPVSHTAAKIDHDCKTCHTTFEWKPATFDHQLTDYPLTGKHADANCSACHASGQFAGLETACYPCHQQDYESVAEPVSHTAARIDHKCETCHTPAEWSPSTFDHQLTDYPLTGAHNGASCSACHSSGEFAGLETACYPCHRQDFESTHDPNHVEKRFDERCQICHTTVAWQPATIDHNQTDFPLTGAHRFASCESCHTAGRYSGVGKECQSCHLVDYDQTSNPTHTESNFSLDCAACHQTTKWRDAEYDHALSRFPLTGAHRNASCRSCHTDGRYTGTNQDCYPCHEAAYEGASSPNHSIPRIDHNCSTCHTTSGWRPSTFNHSATGYRLTGGHLSADCAGCHINGQFAGTTHECYSCHLTDFERVMSPDHRQGQFMQDCTPCHTITGWKPATMHGALSDYPLTGAHRQADCNGCHTNGVFFGTSIDCYGCHRQDFEGADDPNHSEGQFNQNCQACHSTTAWNPATFDHAQTDFPLTGAHQTAECTSCHIDGRFAGTPLECYPCHQIDYDGVENPNHLRGEFDRNCTPCHTTAAWTPSTFDHSATDFPLTGAHQATECTACHVNDRYNNTPQECYPCHQDDYTGAQDPNHQQGQFDQNCASCHSTAAWSPADFDHSSTDFPLTGAHVEVDCQSCHINGRFENTPTECYPCHEVDFNNADDPDHQQLQFDHVCTVCHSVEAWSPAEFDHSNTDFPLTGAHVEVDCQSCHINGRFENTPTECYLCHEADFNNADDPDHQQLQFDHDCTVCHSVEAWSPAEFDHDATDFPLTGAHRQVSCASCHQNGRYAGTPIDCYSCHTADYNNVGNPDHETPRFPRQCIWCHTTDNWNSNYNHQQYFPIGAGRHRQGQEWDLCSECHSNPNDYSVFTCIDCHEHNNRREVDDDHSEVRNYRYTSEGCYDCHPDGRSDDILRPANSRQEPERNQR